MKDLMLDSETLGIGPDGALVSIGAVFFDEDAGTLGDTFYRNINLATAVRDGGVMDPGTVMWWLGQDDAARNAIRFNGEDIRVALAAFKSFIESRVRVDEVRVWGCSPTFDCQKIDRAMARAGLKTPWKYFLERDYRTIRERNLSVEQDVRTGLHNALDDAIFQAKHLMKIRAAQKAMVTQ